MPETIVIERKFLEPVQKEHIKKMMDSSGYSLFKEVICAKCVVSQVKAMNSSLYPDTERALETSKIETLKAARYRNFLDFLDEIEKNDADWFTTNLLVSK